MTRTVRFGSGARRFAAVITVLAALIALMQVTTSSQQAQALSGSDFQDGYIISDANFFDSDSMTADQVQSFLNSKVSYCSAANGMPCLKNYSQWSAGLSGDSYCSGMPSGTMSAAQIIAQVGLSCGISPKVLLVMLQKEQALVTSTAPYKYSYTSAMGMGCPDTAPCDSQYEGFLYQVYYGARQLKLYLKNPSWYAYQLGWNSILYNPSSSCGTKRVYIRNDATRLLYIYTPYTPNQAALNDLYGSGDSCSAYGNRNFWVFYNNWFGNPTGFTVLGDMGARYQAIGGESGTIGSPIAEEVCDWTAGNVNCYQNFQLGAISWTPSTGAWETYGMIRGRWQALNFEHGVLGYPIGAPTCGTKNSGCYQNFQNGAISWTPSTGAWETYGSIRSYWAAQLYEEGGLGYPVGAVTTSSAGSSQQFQGGTVGTSSAGTFEVLGDMGARYQAIGGASSSLGAPIAEEVCSWTAGNVNCFQNFQNGAISWTPSTGAWETYGGIRYRWEDLGFESGALGYPIGPQICGTKDGGCYQNFQNGAISWTSSTGAWETYGSIRSYWAAQRYEEGTLGYPTGGVTTASSSTAKNASSSLSNSSQEFQGGTVVTSSAGTFRVLGDMNERWLAIGGQSGTLGSPIAEEVCNWTAGNVNCYQNFQNGAISWTPSTGAWETYGAIRTRWQATDFERGVLGYPTGAPVCGTKNGGCYQNFQNGAISWTSSTGAWETYGAIRSYWLAHGYEAGSLGYPTGPVTTTSTGATQKFQGGTLTWTKSTNSVKVG
ncbi:hypothetical protein GCM10009785_32510 [Brooklawnia cerclae]|uniref:Uncharacterized protein with LGFP repeats n=1 Tax=Brooklawnia cerclae TaxID=349934 RepID=A0ABX0SDI4_9ACTN|nr:uncharacterized protein with LGFP repeats [Brooklawnia cerclae]